MELIKEYMSKQNYGMVQMTYDNNTIAETKFIENRGYGKDVIAIYEKENTVIDFRTNIESEEVYKKYKGITLNYNLALQLIKELVPIKI